MNRDALVLEHGGKWSFGEAQVASNFDAHIENSVPLYRHSHDLICAFAEFFLSDGALCYDLGCATGRLSACLAARHQQVAIKAIDIESRMLAHAAATHCRELANVELLTADITQFEFVPADLMIACYTLQFIKLRLRVALLHKIYGSLHRGGALLLFEKVTAEDAALQEMTALIHTNFKLERGCQPEQVITKANSLRGVQQPLTASANKKMLRAAGFSRVFTIMKYLCFEGYLALK